MAARARDTQIGSGLRTVVGATIAREREIRGLSIEELAQRASLSAGLVSQLERAIGNPSLKTLQSLATALELPIGAFFEGSASEDDFVVHPETRKRLILSERRISYELLVPDLQGSLAMLYIELPPEFTNEDKPFRHAGEEAVYVVEGRLESHVGERVARMQAGDSIRFASSIAHWYRTFDQNVVVITAMTPPSF
jgi:transcriptional regulator with XRE-family HTH domain